MHCIGVTQRVEVVGDYRERRDALDQRWTEFLLTCGLQPVLIPNNPSAAKNLVEKFPLKGILLTGGNDLHKYGGDALERDETETFLLEWGMERDVPVMGVCRGMQVIQNHFAIELQQVLGHVSPEQTVMIDGKPVTVNSYHKFGTTETKEPLTVWAVAEDGVVEGIRHASARVEGVMWHPERMSPFSPTDIERIKEFFLDG